MIFSLTSTVHGFISCLHFYQKPVRKLHPLDGTRQWVELASMSVEKHEKVQKREACDIRELPVCYERSVIRGFRACAEPYDYGLVRGGAPS